MSGFSWPAAETRLVALRLHPGEDLRGALQAAFTALGEPAGFLVAAVGSLTNARLRPAGRDDALTVPGPLEIVALSGTFSLDGPHLHLSISDAGGAMTGGHLLEGSEVRTTAEVVLAVTPAAVFRRPVDPVTGYAELSVTPPGTGS